MEALCLQPKFLLDPEFHAVAEQRLQCAAVKITLYLFPVDGNSLIELASAEPEHGLDAALAERKANIPLCVAALDVMEDNFAGEGKLPAFLNSAKMLILVPFDSPLPVRYPVLDNRFGLFDQFVVEVSIDGSSTGGQSQS